MTERTLDPTDPVSATTWDSRATWQITLRWLVPPAIVVAVVAAWGLGYRFPAGPVLLVAAAIQTYNLAFWLAFVRRPDHAVATPDAQRRQTVAQVALDYAAMFVLVHYTGGSDSPLAVLFIFHVIFAAILFRPSTAWLFAALATGGMALLALAEQRAWLTYYPLAFRDEVTTAVPPLGSTLADLLFFTAAVAVTAATTTEVMRRLRAENARAYRAVSEIGEQRSRLMLQVAHNLRAPLAASISMVDVITAEYLGAVTHEQRDYLDRVRRRLSDLNGVVGDLLALARGREPGGARDAAPVDLEAIVREVAATFAQPAAAKGLVLSVSTADALPPAMGDPAFLRQVVENLVSNAVKYTPASGRADVTLSLVNEGELQMVVRDTGIGIPRDEQGRLFEDFFRASNARASDAPGSGLGLAFVKAAAEGAGGSVHIDSAEGKGTAVTVVWPAATAPLAVSTTDTSPPLPEPRDVLRPGSA